MGVGAFGGMGVGWRGEPRAMGFSLVPSGGEGKMTGNARCLRSGQGISCFNGKKKKNDFG